jgi:hypothetical protein
VAGFGLAALASYIALALYRRLHTSGDSPASDGQRTDNGDGFTVGRAHSLSQDRVIYTADGVVYVRDLSTGDRQQVVFQADMVLGDRDGKPRRRDFSSRRTSAPRESSTPTSPPTGSTWSSGFSTTCTCCAVAYREPGSATADR